MRPRRGPRGRGRGPRAWPARLAAAPPLALLAACAAAPVDQQAFNAANRIVIVEAPRTAEDAWPKLDCAAAARAAALGHAYFARAKVVLKVGESFHAPPAPARRRGGEGVFLAPYGLYDTPLEWKTAKDARVGDLRLVKPALERCGG